MMLSTFRSNATVPIAIHLDHITDENHLYMAMNMKTLDNKPLLDSVMVDGSEYSLEENILWTSKMAKIAHENGIIVEAELGRLAGEEVPSIIPLPLLFPLVGWIKYP